MATFHLLSTVRVGQITGSTDLHKEPAKQVWPQPLDAERWPLLTDNSPWGAEGADLGANAEHSDGRLYIFFGDTTTHQRKADPPLRPNDDPPINSDMVAWTADERIVRHGGHLPIGLEFVLPFAPTAIAGQPQWRYCLNCAALFWDGDPAFKGVCPRGPTHNAFGVGLPFVLPFEPTPQAGQPEWRFCRFCGVLFFNGGDSFKGRCPAAETHEAAGLEFVLPFATQAPRPPTEGQPGWRFCANCHGLFWNGYADKGVCAGAPGGGFRIQAVLDASGSYEPLHAPEPIGYLGSYETPNGAFSHGGRMYVFAGFSEFKYSERRRAGDPAVGQYLFSKADPSKRGAYDVEFQFSPQHGWCAADPSRSSFVSHHVLGHHFVLPHDLVSDATPREREWRSCRHCEALFWDGDAGFKGLCQRGGVHEADAGPNYALEIGSADDAQNQPDWHRCRKCFALFWNGRAPQTGLCPGGDLHEVGGPALRLPHLSIEEDANHQRWWRFCRKCAGLFFDGFDDKGACPRDGLPHIAQGLEFVIPHELPEDATHQSFWRFCNRCAGMFFDGSGDKGACPRDGAPHTPAGHVFRLPHGDAASFDRQSGWRFCFKCAGLFHEASANASRCPRDGLLHAAAGHVFTLPHNPGTDDNNRGKWRFCTRCHGMARTDQFQAIAWVAPVRVANGDHPVLRKLSRHGSGLMMIGFDWNGAFRLAWMPLHDGQTPRLDSIRYYHAGKGAWADVPDNDAGYALFMHPYPGSYTHVSALWLADIGHWVVLYGTAWDLRKLPNGELDAERFDAPIHARFSRDLVRWSEPVEVFAPETAGAYGRYMHKPRRDRIHPDVPPPQRPGFDDPGWAYGAFLLERFCRLRARGRLDLHYLMSTSSPYQVHVMYSRLQGGAVAPRRMFHGGGGIVPSDGNVPYGRTFFGVAANGDLHWHRYEGDGEPGLGGGPEWHPNSDHAIGNGWNGLARLIGAGNGVMLGVMPDGELRWYTYQGTGQDDVTGSKDWHPNSGNPIGNGWGSLSQLVALPRSAARPGHVTLLGVGGDGALLWFGYQGHGESDISGSTGWHPNSGNPIGNGWQGLRHLHGSGDVVFGVRDNGDLLWFSYTGDGASDSSGATGWHPNSGNAIGNGWLGLRFVFGGPADDGAHEIYVVTTVGELRWYRYEGRGEADVSGATGWHPNSGTRISLGW